MHEKPSTKTALPAKRRGREERNRIHLSLIHISMSTADSQMLAAASSVSQNILQEFGLSLIHI